jgi:hypothetical protein
MPVPLVPGNLKGLDEFKKERIESVVLAGKCLARRRWRSRSSASSIPFVGAETSANADGTLKSIASL